MSEALNRGDLNDLRDDLRGYINDRINDVRRDIGGVNSRLDTINGRVGKAENLLAGHVVEIRQTNTAVGEIERQLLPILAAQAKAKAMPPVCPVPQRADESDQPSPRRITSRDVAIGGAATSGGVLLIKFIEWLLPILDRAGS